MKKLITLLAVAGLVLALAPAAQAAVIMTDSTFSSPVDNQRELTSF